jgi:ribosomal protein L22
MVPQVTVEEFLTRYRNKHNAYYDVADDVLIEKVLEKYPVYKDRLSDYASPQVQKLVKENNPWLDKVKLENPWGKSFENSSLLPQNSGIQKSMMAEDMRETVNAKLQRQRDVISAFQSLDPNSKIISNADEAGEGMDDGEFAIDTSVGGDELTGGPELYINEYSLDPVVRKRQLEDLQKRWRLEPKRIEDQRIKQTELALAGQPIDQALQLEQYSNLQTPMMGNEIGSVDLDPNLQNLSMSEQSEEIQLRNQMNVGASAKEDAGILRSNALIVDEFEAKYGPGVSDTKTLFGGLNYRETVQNPEAFSKWLYDAKSGKLQTFAYDRILKGGPTPEMIVYANKKYGATSKEEIAEKISEDPYSPWADYFFPIESYESTHKMGKDTNLLLKNGLVNPNFQQNIYYNNAPSKGIPWSIWSTLNKEQKAERINRGEGNITQIEEVRDPYKSFYDDFDAIATDETTNILKSRQPANLEEYTTLANFFKGKVDKDGNSLDFVDFDRGNWENFTNRLDASTDWQSLFQFAVGGPAQYDHYDKKIAQNNLEDWWDSIKNNNTVIEYISRLSQKGGKSEEERLIIEQGFQEDPSEQREVLYSQEELNRPLSEKEAAEIRAAAERGEDPMRFKVPKDNKKYQKEKSTEFISKQTDKLMSDLDKLYAEINDEGLSDTWDFEYDNLFNEAGNIDSYDKIGIKKDDIPEDAYTGPGSVYNLGLDIVNNEGITDLEGAKNARNQYYYELRDLARIISSKAGEVGSERYDGTIANVVGKLATEINDYRGSKDTWTEDIKRLNNFAKTGEFGDDFRLIRSSHPLAKQFNETLKRLQAIHEVVRLNRDPFSTEKEYDERGKISGVLRTIGSTWDNMFTKYDMFDAIGGGAAEIGDDERAQEISNYLSSARFDTHDEHIKERLSRDWDQQMVETAAGIAPLVAEVMLVEVGGGGAAIAHIGAWANRAKTVGRGSKLWNGLVTSTFGGARNWHTTAMHGTRYLKPSGASAIGEMIKLGAADEIGNFTYGREKMGLTFGASMGYGMSFAESLMQSSLGRKIPFLVPIMRRVSESKVIPSRFLNYQGQAALGAGIGFMSMQVAEAGQGYANQLLGEGQYDLAHQLAQMKDLDFVLGQFMALRLLGMRPNKVYDALSKDIHYMFKGPYVEYNGAKKSLGIVSDNPIDGIYETKNDKYESVDDAYNAKADEILNDPKYNKDYDSNGYIKENSELYNKMSELAEAKSTVEQHADLMLAKKFAAEDQAKNGSLNKYKNNLYLLKKDLTNGNPPSPELAEWVGQGSVTPEVLAQTLGESKSFAERFINEQGFVMEYASRTGVYGNSKYRNKVIKQAQDLVGLKFQEAALKRSKENGKEGSSLIDTQLKENKQAQDDLYFGNEDKGILGLDPSAKYSYFNETLGERTKIFEKSNKAAKETLEYYKEKGGSQGAELEVLGPEEMKTRFPNEYAAENDGFFHTEKDGSVKLIVNEEIAIERNPATASHELFHWTAQGAFKDAQGKVTPEGKSTIDAWLDTLSSQQLKAINKRINKQYKYRKGRRGREKDANFYEEHVPIFIDALSKGEVNLPPSFAKTKIGEKLQEIFGNELDIDLSTPAGITFMVGAINKQTSRGKINPTIKKFIDKKVKSEDVVGETVEPTEKIVEEKIEVEEPAAEQIEVEDIVAKTIKPTIEKVTKGFESKEEIIESLGITDKKAIDEINKADEEGFGVGYEVIDLKTTGDTKTATIDVKGLTLEVPVKSDIAFSRSEPVVNPEKKKIINQITELVKDGKEKNQSEIKELQEKLKKFAQPEVKIRNFDDLAKVNYRQYVITDEDGKVDLEKSKEAWDKSPEREKVLEFVYNSPKIKANIDSKLSETIQEGDRLIAQEKAFTKLITELGRFNPGKVAEKGSSTILSFINTKLGQRSADIGKSTVKKGKTESLDKPTGSDEGRVMTKGDNLVATETEAIDPIDISRATMRKNEALALDPAETKVFENTTKKFIQENATKLLSGKKAVDGVFESNLTKAIDKELVPMIENKMPKGYKQPYSDFIQSLAPELRKLASTKRGKDKIIEGDPYVFINRGGEQFRGLFYDARGFTKSGEVKRIQVEKGKENPAWDWKQPTDAEIVDFFVTNKPGKPRNASLRKPLARIIAKTIIKDYTNKTIREAWKDRVEGKKDSDNPFSKLTDEQLTKTAVDSMFADVANTILRHEEFIASSSENPRQRFKDFDKEFEGIFKSLEEKWRPTNAMMDFISPSAVISDAERFMKEKPAAFNSWLEAHRKGTVDAWHKNNTEYNNYFESAIIRGELEKAYQAREETYSFKKGIDKLPDTVKWNGKNLDISGLKKFLLSKEGSMYGSSKKKGGNKVNWFNETILKKYTENAIKFGEKLPDWLNQMANKEAVLQTLGLGTTPTGKSSLSVQESIIRIEESTQRLIDRNKNLRDSKPEGWEKSVEENNKKIKALREKEPTPKIGLQSGKEMYNMPWVRNQGEKAMSALGKNESKAFKGLKEKLKDFYGDSQMKTRMKKEFKDLTDAEIAEFVSTKINEGNNAVRREVYDAIQKAKEEFIQEAKTEAEAMDRIEYVLRKAKENTNLVDGLDRQSVPIEAIYWPQGKKLNLENIKLEHLKTSVQQSMQSAAAIVKGKWSTEGKNSMKDYVGVLSPKRLLDIIDMRGKTTNTSTISRMVLDLAELKNYRTVESGFKETYYDKIIRESFGDIKLTPREMKIIKGEALASTVAEAIASGKKSGEVIIKNALKPENAKELKKVFEENQANGVFSRSEKPGISNQVSDMAIADLALELGRKKDKQIKKARIFDFDDTVARTKSNVLYTMPDGRKGKLTAEEFAKKGEMLMQQGGKMDFSEFNKVVDGKKGPLFDVMKRMKEAAGDRDLFILTARAQESAPAIHKFLNEMGIKIPLENITGLGNSTGAAKGEWVLKKASEGYNDFYFADDAIQNVKAVKEVLSQIDVKSKVQQALSSSADLSREFNKLIEASGGPEWYKEFSPAKGAVIGRSKGRGKFFLPSSAEDYLGLVYTTLGKGKIGENQLKWYEKNIINPYSRGTRSLATERVNMMADFKALKKQLDVPKDLRKTTESGFTNEQAVRVYMFEKFSEGDVPGLSKTDKAELMSIVENSPKLKAFGDQLGTLLKNGEYAKPKAEWLAGTITTDLIDVLKARRSHYLEEFNTNVDKIYSKENLNKLEAVYGTKYREALESSIKRMKSGSNRTSTGNKLSDGILDYINGAQGTIMFFNMRSALLQGISSVNFVNTNFNNPIKAGKALANMPQYSKDFKKLMNSEYLVDRRNGLKLNISESEIADAANSSKNKAKAIINYILEKGYTPTKFMDSFAIASGGATWYRNKIKDLMKKDPKMTEVEAEKIAYDEFIKLAEKSQQSSDPSKISSQQSSDIGRIFLQFVNTPMQYTRIQKRAAQDLINRRGDWKENISKILYYGFMQNLWFNAMQQGLFVLGFGDEEMGEKEEKKVYDTANGMVDSILRGTGFAGITVSVLKNTMLDLYERSGKDRPEYADAWQTLLQFSPAIKSKFSKLKQAGWYFDSKKRRQEMVDKGFSLDNPAYEAAAKVISATTNIPLDRLFNKYHNLENVFADDTENWARIASFFGWPAWQLETSGQSKASDAKLKANDPTKYESWEQKSILKQYGLTDPQIRKKYKNKEERAKAILRLQNTKNKTFTPKEEHKSIYYKPRK